jgi:pyruvate/2-oxoglutarate dehydrogenase complex dihydrolipoamide acyltransferase (E2) component
MEEATILAWLKSDGERVSRGDKLAEIETDKASIAYEADVDGTLKVLARAGDTVPVGTTIAFIGDADAAAEQAQTGPRPTEYPEPAVASSELPGSPLATASSRHLLWPGVWPVSCGSSWRR